MHSSRRLIFVLLVLVVSVPAGCDEGASTSPAAPSALEVLTAPDSVPVASTHTVAVRVLDANDDPLAGAQVGWLVTTGGGSVAADTTSTGPDGTTRTDWTLGEEAGPQSVEVAAAEGVTAEIPATALPGPVESVALDGDSATLEVGDTARLAADAADRYGNSVPDPELAWSSSDTTVARVNDTGRVIALTAGAARIMASANGAADTLVFTVEEPGFLACTELSFDVTSAVPLDTVPVRGLPDTLETPIYAEVVAADTTVQDTGLTFMDRDDGAAGYMIAPLVPGGNGDGGAVSVRVTDGSRSCSPLDFTVESLPEAIGTASAVADSLAVLVELLAGRFGVQPTELENVNLDTLPKALWPLAIGHEMIAGPSNDNSLRAILDGTAPVLDGDGIDLTLTDRIMALGGVEAALGEQLDSLRAGRTAAADLRVGLQSGGTAAAVSRLSCDPGAVTDPSTLHTCMNIQYSAGFQYRSMKDVRTYMGVAFGAAGLAPGMSTVSFVAGAVLFLHSAVLEGTTKLLPSHFVDGDFFLADDYYLEDEPGPDEWHSAWVKAASNGWSLEQAVLSTILQVMGASSVYEEYIDKFMRDTSIDDEILEFIETQIASAAIQATDGANIIQIAPDTTLEVGIDSAEWSQQRVNGEAIALTAHREYEPMEVGTAHIVVGTVADSFPGAHYESVDTVEVDRIVVTVDPPERTVNPGDTVSFRAVVAKAMNPAIDPRPTRGAATVTATNDSVHTLQVVTPTDTSVYPYLLNAYSTTSTGARSHSTTPRLGQAFLYKAGSITVSPDDACVPHDSTQQFTADVHGLQNREVTWSTSAGTIGGDGVLTAPAIDTEVVVTATSEEDSSVKGTTTALVRETCESYARWSGSGGGISASGPYVNVVVDTATGTAVIGMNEDMTDDTKSALVLTDKEGEVWGAALYGSHSRPSAGAAAVAMIIEENADGSADTTELDAGEPYVDFHTSEDFQTFEGGRAELTVSGPAVWWDSVNVYTYYEDGTESPGDPPREVNLYIEMVCKGDGCTFPLRSSASTNSGTRSFEMDRSGSEPAARPAPPPPAGEPRPPTRP